jgi:hypothetical protein
MGVPECKIRIRTGVTMGRDGPKRGEIGSLISRVPVFEIILSYCARNSAPIQIPGS